MKHAKIISRKGLVLPLKAITVIDTDDSDPNDLDDKKVTALRFLG